MKEELEKVFHDMCEMYHKTEKRYDPMQRCQLAMYIIQFYNLYRRS